MKLPKLRLTWGNVLGAITAAAGVIVGHSDLIVAASPKTGGSIVTAGALILAVTSNMVSHNSDQIPAEQKVDVGPIVLEKTGPLKP